MKKATMNGKYRKVLKYKYTVTAPGGGGGGGTRGVRHTGMCRSNRSLFWEKSLNIGYGFELEILKHTRPTLL